MTIFIKRRYLDVAFIAEEYKVSIYPTYSFFFPDGRLIHKASAYQKVQDFIETAEIALTPERYWTMIL